MEMIESIRGKTKITYNGYTYVKQKLLEDEIVSYECEKRRGKGRLQVTPSVRQQLK